jgi:O-antigen ligase
VLVNAGKAHNQLLSVAAEGGVPLALLFLALLAALAVRLYRAPPSPARLAGLGALGFFVLLCLAHDPLFHAVLSQALALTVGASLGLAERQSATVEAPAAVAVARP